MTDIFDEIVTCSKCKKRMHKVKIVKEGFVLRALECKGCGKYIYHPSDLEEYNKFQELKRKAFLVKLRMVGNSYIVSIPHEIIKLQQEMHKEMTRHIEKMKKIVRIALEEPTKLSIFFDEPEKNKRRVK